jgi:antitoxin ParD1/3/4
MNVSLTPELEKKVDERVGTGLYTSASELVREALRLFFQYDEARRRQIADLNSGIDQAIAELDRGEGLSPEESRRQRRARRAALSRGAR